MLHVENLRIVFNTRDGASVAVENLSFKLNAGEVLGIVGESGSGKSVACYSLLGLLPMPPGKIESGSAMFSGQDLLRMSEAELRKIRGHKISMIFQDPMTSLNPYMRISDQLVESVLQHHKISKKAARQRAIDALNEVGIRDAETRIDQYPHQFSGGMRQRVMIAMALIAEPELLIADEPTTALDVSVQAQILKLIKQLQVNRKLAVIFITHDLGVAAQMADHILVMEKGKLVEQGKTEDIFNRPTQPYTQKLLRAVLTTAKPTPSLADKAKPPFLEVKQLKTWFPQFGGLFIKHLINTQKAVDDISLTIYRGEILGVVGESGSGKSTLGRTIMRLVEAHSGEVLLEGKDLLRLSESDLKNSRRHFQMIFQDPYASLNPRMTVFDTLAEPLLVHGLATKKTVLELVNQLMDDVGLDRRFIRKYPHEFSGGQRQRIAIARAIALKPKLIIADEPVSALDVTIRAQILKLLLELTQKHQLTMLFISHDMSVVRYLCDRVLVMQNGRVIEEGETEALFSAPKESYTQQLLAAIPKL
ncbi:microcin C ABC transporter ATP-binding protein YejF [Cellvibrio zantedeschiae]|uniref:Microcin C ABC transporter ATP-binding protein YejF n=1 Tax=Cellvibrio zantedeschiae TaxID=1237077 RepID=A0ABQ3AZC7_9GAMM|nr:ABC transporter ATP-binding protein [Cellvibrio zantedeschiae]GGY71502.1 microcin C ABC transporter ATP-binding protein YejF [Cellvibrio zantedeschiae]